MKYRIFLLPCLLTLSTLALADVRCAKDTFGAYKCRDTVSGTTSKSTKDYFGNINTRFSDGRTAKTRRDAFGNDRTRYSDGSTSTGKKDYFGNYVIRRSDGSTMKCKTDPFDKQICR